MDDPWTAAILSPNRMSVPNYRPVIPRAPNHARNQVMEGDRTVGRGCHRCNSIIALPGNRNRPMGSDPVPTPRVGARCHTWHCQTPCRVPSKAARPGASTPSSLVRRNRVGRVFNGVLGFDSMRVRSGANGAIWWLTTHFPAARVILRQGLASAGRLHGMQRSGVQVPILHS